MIIAVDFDNTLFEFVAFDPVNVGKPILQTIEFVRLAKEAGHRLILWTCREGEALSNAETACACHGLFFDAINDNLPNEGWPNSRKVYADLYIDDKAINHYNLGVFRDFFV